MKLATHKTYLIYLVIDHEDDARTYQFDNKESALEWKKELVDDFGTNEGNVSVIERRYDEYGNWLAQKYI